MSCRSRSPSPCGWPRPRIDDGTDDGTDDPKGTLTDAEEPMTADTLPPATARPAERPAVLPGRNLALVLGTLGLAVNFWAWSLLSPLAPRYQELLGLSPLAV